MNYIFPRIETIDDVLPAISGRDEFVVANKGPYTVINYNVAFNDTFPLVEEINDAIRRECRGIIFGENGEIIARRLHKFFNLNERPETTHTAIDFDAPHIILDKLDGSMITPFKVSDGGIRWGTKMGETDISKPVQVFVGRNDAYTKFAAHLINEGYTPIFEWCSRKQRIVIDHPVDRLTCIAIRNMITGEYMDYSSMISLCRKYDIEHVLHNTSMSLDDMETFLYNVRSMKGIEGFVIRFNNGHMLKIKTEEYLQYHKALSYLSFEKDILRLVVENKTDDFKPILSEELQQTLSDYEENVLGNLRENADRFYSMTYEWTQKHGFNKKDYAIGFVNNPHNEFKTVEKKILFNILNENSITDANTIFRLLLELVKDKTSTSTKVDEIRHLIGNTTWVYGE